MSIRSNKLNPRVLIFLKNSNASKLYLSSLGTFVHISPNISYLHILNSVEFIKANTSSNERLKLGESFYFYFHITKQFLSYDQKQNTLFLTRILAERTLFKIISDTNQWKNQGIIKTSLNQDESAINSTKYRIKLAEYSSKYLSYQSETLCVSSIYQSNVQQIERSYFYFEDSIYYCPCTRYPVKLITLQNSLVIAHYKWEIVSKLKIGAHASMFIIQDCQQTYLKAIKHVQSGKYLTVVNQQILLGKNLQQNEKQIFNVHFYDQKGEYVYLQVFTHEGFRNITTINDGGKCEIGNNGLANVMKKQYFKDQQLQNLVAFAWLKAELETPRNEENINIILSQLIELFQQFYEVYEYGALRNLIEEGLLKALQETARKYEWRIIGDQIYDIICLMVKVDNQFLCDLLKVEKLYFSILEKKDFSQKIHQIKIVPSKLNQEIIQNASKIILAKSQIRNYSLEAIILISDILRAFDGAKNQYILELQNLVHSICEQTVEQLDRKLITNKYISGLEIILLYQKQQFICKKVLPKLSLQAINNDKSLLKDSLDLIEIIEKQCPPFVYVATDVDGFDTEMEDNLKVFNKKLSEFVMNYIEDILPKNARFQTYQSKIFSLALCRLAIRFKFGSIDSFQCKKLIKLILQNIDNLKNSGYQQQKYGRFIIEGLKSLRELFKLYIYLLCQQNIKYDSITINIQDKIGKALKEFDDIGPVEKIFGNGIWSLLDASSSASPYSFFDNQILKSSDDNEVIVLFNVMLTFLEIGFHISNKYHEESTYFIKYLKPLNEPNEQFKQLMRMFINKEYQYNWNEIAKFILQTSDSYTQAEYSSLMITIHQNDLYKWIAREHNNVNYQVLSQIIVQNEKGLGGSFDGKKLLYQLFGQKSYFGNQRQWIQSDQEFILMSNILSLMGGVVCMEVYEIYEEYICHLNHQKWSLYSLHLSQCFFSFLPQLLKQKFAINYQHLVFEKVDNTKMRRKLRESEEQFVLAYVTLLSKLANYHLNKILIYNMIGDQTLFQFLQIHQKNNQLKVAILNFMIKTRVKKYQQFNFMLQNQEYEWFKYGTLFIRQQTTNAPEMKKSQFPCLQQYTFILIEFLRMREQMLEFSDFSENQMLVIEGTNKLCAFEIADLIQIALNTDNLSAQSIQKIQWFESTYKINTNSLQMTRLIVDHANLNSQQQNFSYIYKLQINDKIASSVQLVEAKFGLSNFITLLLRVLTAYTINMDHKNDEKVKLILHYFHFIVNKRSYNYIEKEIKALFLAMQQHIRYKKFRQVAILQNIIRKAIWKGGKIDPKRQIIVQNLMIQNKEEICNYFSSFIDHYLIFTPFYDKNNSYFTQKAENQINWIITQYISMIRFILCLTKSLNLEFKSIFAESSVFKKEIVAKIIHATQKHCQALQNPSKLRLTLITYELDLINSLILGPQLNNVNSAIKYEYPSLIINKLMILDDYSNFKSIEEQQKYRIILKMKEIIAETLFTIADFYDFTVQQTQKIQSSLILYYKQSRKLYQSHDFDKIILFYSKKNKNSLVIKSFDLALHLFYAIIKIYEQQQNTIIKKIKGQQLQSIRLIKYYNKKFKMFYQIYRLTIEVFIWLGNILKNCCHSTANQINLDQISNFFQNIGNTHQQRLKTVFNFFTKHVSNIEIQVGDKVQTVYYLLLKQAQCYNPSIRKEFHRKIGLGCRQYRLSKFMQISNHIVLRLQVEKSIKSFTEKYKPFDIIIKNRQLWKSMNFLCACLLNLVFLDQSLAENNEVPENILRSLSYLFCSFLFIIYFIQNLPLKRKLAAIYARDTKRSKFRYIKSCLQIFNDKTLWFASIYFIILSLSFYELGFVSLLMIDFFVRFKISKKVTEIVTRPIGHLFLIILMSVQIAFVYTCYLYFVHYEIDCPNTATCIQNTYKTYLGINKNQNLPITSTILTFRNITTFFFAFFNIFVTMSLIIGVLLYEKKAKDIKTKQWEFQLERKCFICDTERSEIDRHRNDNQGFFEHIQEEHNLWSYMFYLVFLKNKEVESMNVIESMVIQQWNKKGIEWLPKTYQQNL